MNAPESLGTFRCQSCERVLAGSPKGTAGICTKCGGTSPLDLMAALRSFFERESEGPLMVQTFVVSTRRPGKWHIPRHPSTGYGVWTFCGLTFNEGEFREHGPGVAGCCRRCEELANGWRRNSHGA